MAYTITKTNGLNPIVIPDGTINTSTSVSLVGKNYPNYGAILDQNFLRLLENSANSSAPSSPLTGELWWDSGNTVLKVYTGSQWKNVGSTTTGATAPSSATSNVGDLWWKTGGDTGQLYGFDGGSYTLIGPIGGAAGVTSESITASNDAAIPVLSFTIGNSRYCILSASPEFTPKTPISGFAKIYPGLNLSNTSFLSNAKFAGQSTDAVTLTGLYANAFLRADQNTSTPYTLSVLNNTGLYVGTGSNMHLAVSAPNVAVINETNNGAMNFKVRNSGGTQLTAMDIYPNGNVVANFDFLVQGNISFGSSANDLVISGSSQSINPQTGALRLSVGGLGVAGNINTGGSNNNFVGQVRAATLVSNSTVNAANLISSGSVVGTIATNAQPYVTSLGTLSGLTVSGAVSATSIGGYITQNAQPYINSVGTLSSLTVSGTTTLGANTNVKITGGTNGQFLITDGSGNLSWQAITGASTQIAYFSGGLLANSSALTWNGSSLYVNGAVNVTGDITAFYSSDAKLKTNVEVISDALSKVSTLSGVTFNWNELGLSTFDSTIDKTEREAGVIAQEVQSVLPEAVVERTNGYLAVNYEKIVPLLIEAIKELKIEVETLKKLVGPQS